MWKKSRGLNALYIHTKVCGHPFKLVDSAISAISPPQVWFILGSNLQMPEGTTFICTNNST